MEKERKLIMENGTRIIFMKDVIEPANGEHPAFLLAKKNELGRIKEYVEGNWYYVDWDGWSNSPFLAEVNVDFISCDELKVPSFLADETPKYIDSKLESYIEDVLGNIFDDVEMENHFLKLEKDGHLFEVFLNPKEDTVETIKQKIIEKIDKIYFFLGSLRDEITETN